jgi:uncharacterized protein
MRDFDPTYYTLITGASAGIGKAMAYEAARRGQNLVLIALPNSKLDLVAASLKIQYQISVECIEIDLCDINAPLEIFQICKVNRWEISILINNAGIGTEGVFFLEESDQIEKLIALNITSLTLLTRYFLPDMVRNKKGHILNVSSFSGFHPFPYKATYGASKAYVLSLSQALRSELKKTNIKVSVVCPGGVITNSAVLERIKTKGTLARLGTLLPRHVAREAFEGLFNGKSIIIPGVFTKFTYLVSLLMPKYYRLKVIGGIFGKDHKLKIKLSKEKIH